MLRTLGRATFLLALLLALLAAGAYLLALQPQSHIIQPPAAKVPVAPSLTRLGSTEDDLLLLRDNELALFINQLMVVMSIDVSVELQFTDQGAQALVSLALPVEWKRRYLNLRLRARSVESQAQPTLDNLSVGRVPVPAIVRAAMRPLLVGQCLDDRRCRAVLEVFRNVETVQFSAHAAKIGYRLKSIPINPGSLQLQPYFDTLKPLLRPAKPQPPRQFDLHTALQAVFAVAADRAALPGHEAARENTAALLALAIHNTDERLLIAYKIQYKLAALKPGKTVTVHQRGDLAQHFLNSAALYLIGGSEFGDYIGMYKELYDVTQGKPFGAGDLVADRAGVRFAKQATLNDQKAHDFQQKLLQQNDSSAYLLSKPAIDDLAQRHDIRTTEQINAIVTEIDQSLARLALLN